DPERMESIVRVNVLGTAYCGAHAIRRMLPNSGGSIVNITSGAQSGYAARAMYGAAKGAAASMTYAWAAGTQGSGIRVNTLGPLAKSTMRTAMADYDRSHGRAASKQPDAEPQDNAPLVIHLLSDAAAGISGQVFRFSAPRLSLMS